MSMSGVVDTIALSEAARASLLLESINREAARASRLILVFILHYETFSDSHALTITNGVCLYARESMPQTSAPKIKWEKWPDKFKAVPVDERPKVQHVLKLFFKYYFNPDHEDYKPKKRRRLKKALFEVFKHRAQALAEDKEMSYLDGAYFVLFNWSLLDDVGLAKILNVSWPFAQALTTGQKVIELRKKRLKHIGQRFFIREMATVNTELQFDPGLVGDQAKLPDKIVGALLWSGCRELTKQDLTADLAKKVFLTENGLKKAWDDGYKYAWEAIQHDFFVLDTDRVYPRGKQHGRILSNALEPPAKKQRHAEELL